MCEKPYCGGAMLGYTFMRRALFVGIILGIVIPLVGVIVINRKTSTMGDALSHTSLAGIGFGLLFGFSPVIGAIAATLIAALSIEAIRKKFPGRGDMATAMIMSTGVGIASILSDIVPTSTNFESFLFGSIITITNNEAIISIILSIITFAAFFHYYHETLYISVDREGARISGVSVKRIDFLFTILIAVMIAISSRVIGVLMVSSLMILPVASSISLMKSYKGAVILSMFLGAMFVAVGLWISFYFDVKPGGAIVLIGVAVFLLMLLVRRKYEK